MIFINMGKNIVITEKQLIKLGKYSVLEGQKIESLKSAYDKFKTEMDKIYEIKDFSNEIFDFLDNVRLSGMVNMYQSPDLLWSGSVWISKWADLHAPHLTDDDYDEETDFSASKEAFENVLNSADDVRDKLIRISLRKVGDNYENVDRTVKKISRDIVMLWMRHGGTSVGRMKTEVDEIARTLAKARKHGADVHFPKSAIKNAPNRFRPSVRLDETFFFADVENEVICDNCGHSWEIKDEDPHPHLCHLCAYDQKKEDFDIDSVIEFWDNKKED